MSDPIKAFEIVDAQLQEARQKIAHLERVNKEHGQNLAKVITFCRKTGIGQLGESYIENLLVEVEKLGKENSDLKNLVDITREKFLVLDEMDVDSQEYADLLMSIFNLFCGGSDAYEKAT